MEPEATAGGAAAEGRGARKAGAVNPDQVCCRCRQEPAFSSLKTDTTKSPLVVNFLSTMIITVSKGKPQMIPKSQTHSPWLTSGSGRDIFKDALVKVATGQMLGFLSAPCPRPPSDVNAFK